MSNTKFLIKSFVKKYVAWLLPYAGFVKYYRTAANILKIDGIKVQWHPFIKKESIVIYSEDIYGNPLNADNVVRWLLYYYDYKNDSKAYSKDDLFIAYRDIFNDSLLNPKNYIVTINYFNKKLYRQYNFSDREGACYIIYKGINRTDLPQVFDGPVIDHSMSHEEIVEVLNKYKYCYCYDPQTYFMRIAVACGCIPILIMENGKDENDYLSISEHHYGIAYGNTPEQIQYAIDTRVECLNELDYSVSNKLNIENLVKILKINFGNITQI